MRSAAAADGPLADELVEPALVSSEVAFDGAIWQVRRDTFDLGEDRLTRELLAHPGAVAVLALDDDDEVVLIRQYRHPVAAHEWELPAGLLDVAGEQPLLAAQRELAEEVDLTAERWAVLADHWSSPGSSDEALRIYLARGLAPVAEEDRFAREGEEAQIVVRRVPLEEVHAAVLAGRLHNPSLTIGVLTAVELRRGGWGGLRPADAPWPEHPAHR